MSEIKTKLWFAGGPTWRPSAKYSPRRQHEIIERLFGAANSEGPIVLPDGSNLYIGYRNNGKPGYSNGHKPKGKGDGFALFTPSKGSGNRRIMIDTQRITIGADGLPGETYVGFLPQAFKMILLLGRHSLKESVAGEKLPFRPLSGDIKEGARLLTDTALWDAISGDPDGNPELWLQDFWESMERTLGPNLAGLEFPDAEKHNRGFEQLGLEEKPFERFTVDMIGRVAEIMR
ncbi:MAG: hypothetical protein H6799_00345 [Candidatus Nomurabacteria bacterium]|nr:MAG: hypothetical protein H6799_00345 [Candidatus Nomurabacteria bacterium]HRV76280.1 hypothetical protein [Candidatus Saccharimonadales bacterium]